METLNEKLPQDVIEKLRKLQSDSNNIVNELGQIEIRFLDLKKYKKSLEETFINLKEEMDSVLSELEKEYPNGEINLNDGTVTFIKNNLEN